MSVSVIIKDCETMRAGSVHVVMRHAIVEVHCVNVVIGVHIVETSCHLKRIGPVPALGKEMWFTNFQKQRRSSAACCIVVLLVSCCFGTMVKKSKSPSTSASSWYWAAIACVVCPTVVGLVDDRGREWCWLFQSAAHKVAHGMI